MRENRPEVKLMHHSNLYVLFRDIIEELKCGKVRVSPLLTEAVAAAAAADEKEEEEATRDVYRCLNQQNRTWS